MLPPFVFKFSYGSISRDSILKMLFKEKQHRYKCKGLEVTMYMLLNREKPCLDIGNASIY
jgi:hypothetical protein